jgi:hypothetical protein
MIDLKPTSGFQNLDTSQNLTLGGQVKVKESLYTRLIMLVNIILTHINTRAIFPRCEGSCMVYELEWHCSKDLPNTPYPIGAKSVTSSISILRGS